MPLNTPLRSSAFYALTDLLLYVGLFVGRFRCQRGAGAGSTF